MTHLAPRAAETISHAFDTYQQQFKEITRRAHTRFENRDWRGMQHDAVERLGVREQIIRRVIAEVRLMLGEHATDKIVWAQMKAAYLDLINCRPNPQLAETFFSSVTRRIFATEGVDGNIEFVDSEFDCEGPPAESAVYTTFASDTPRALVRQILGDCDFQAPFQDFERDTRLVAERIEAQRQALWGEQPIEKIEVLRSVFYRGKEAFLIGRLRGGKRLLPLVLALFNSEQGIVVDTVLLDEDDASIVFSFTRSYFHVEIERPRDVVLFLRSIMPAKRIAELYISIGYHKHGKTELYRDFIHHLENSNDQFEIAPGERGMVMVVFTLPSYDLVFKVIRDKFAYPKTTAREDVMEKYNLVFKHDRAGRLVDAQEFEHLQFPRQRFSDKLIAELTTFAPSSISFDASCIFVKHLYIERRVTPLNLYLRQVDFDTACATVLDYGQVLKDLARTNIFPGDLLLKNFGVTRHGRVIFYDYDELTRLTDCNFRDLPQAHDVAEEMADEPWFYVGPNDVFPEEFVNFLGLPDDLRAVFLRTHGDLLHADFWRRMQARHRAGEIMDIFPYTQSKRLHAPTPPGQ
ncbi:MAG: bifunctional isocitrate dehydrogenase kinase/phosphatase [Chloroflexi bacterium]|nr:bifunctional isocitrate dehydrogenase kinase/phosphatase [Chloroflexota bacterium]